MPRDEDSERRWERVIERLNRALFQLRTDTLSASDRQTLADDVMWVVQQAPQLLEQVRRARVGFRDEDP
ncbi:MAG: hypothetical protein AAF602_10090 [Myxococcota bacterium]